MLTCIASGIPETYIFGKWEHKSDYGDHIRFLTGNTNGSLILPVNTVNETDYQNNGFYRCSVSNGIPDSNGLMKQYSDILLDVKGTLSSKYF